MPLEFEVRIVGIDQVPANRIREALERHQEKPEFINLPGVSLAGPCELCIPWFYVRHDGSDTDVPVPPIHDSCVCRMVQVALYELGEDRPRYFEPGEWMERTRPGQRLLHRAVGVTRSRLLRSGAIDPQALYRRGDFIRGPANLASLARRLASDKSTARELIAFARRQGMDIERGASARAKIGSIIQQLRRR